MVGVRPSLPVEGVDIIMGNNLAGGRVWPDIFSPPVVSSFLSLVLMRVIRIFLRYLQHVL